MTVAVPSVRSLGFAALSPTRPVGLAALAVLVVLAGCGGLTANVTPTPTATPAPVPTATPTATPPETVAPGVGRDGSVRVERLLDSHDATLSNRSYTVTISRVVTGANGTVDNVTSRFETAPNASRYRFVQYTTGRGRGARAAAGEPQQAVDLWHNESLTLFRGSDSTGRPYVRAHNLDSEPIDDPTFRRYLRELLTGFRFRVASSGPSVRLVATGLLDRSVLTPPPTFANPSNVSLTVTVGPSGVVRSTRLSYDATNGTRRVRVVRTSRVSAVGNTTVSVPAWAPIDRDRDGERDPITPGGRIDGV